MKQVIVQKSTSGMELAAADAAEPKPAPGEAAIAVHSISLNRGEVSRAFFRSEHGWAPGWDFAGTIVEPRDCGIPAGTRVAGFKPEGAWAERIAAAPHEFAAIPDGISFETASALPLAGLTALYALQKGGSLLGKRVLITGASGGMGQLAVQLALASGAHVTAAVYRNAIAAPRGIAADRLRVVRMDDEGLKTLANATHDLIVEGVGGDVFRASIEGIAPRGTMVVLGATRENEARFEIRRFFNAGRAQIYAFNIFDEIEDKPISAGLSLLFDLVLRGDLSVPLGYTGGVAEIDSVARRLLDSQIPGKAVLSWDAA